MTLDFVTIIFAAIAVAKLGDAIALGRFMLEEIRYARSYGRIRQRAILAGSIFCCAVGLLIIFSASTVASHFRPLGPHVREVYYAVLSCGGIIVGLSTIVRVRFASSAWAGGWIWITTLVGVMLTVSIESIF